MVQYEENRWQGQLARQTETDSPQRRSGEVDVRSRLRWRARPAHEKRDEEGADRQQQVGGDEVDGFKHTGSCILYPRQDPEVQGQWDANEEDHHSCIAVALDRDQPVIRRIRRDRRGRVG